MFSRTKWLPASILGTSWVRPSRVCAQTRPLGKVEFRGADRIVVAASVVDCCGGRRSCSVICEVVMADHSGTAVYRWCLELLAWCRSCVRNTIGFCSWTS